MSILNPSIVPNPSSSTIKGWYHSQTVANIPNGLIFKPTQETKKKTLNKE
jgi:hypothetical protein